MELVQWGWLFGVHNFEVQKDVGVGFGGAELALHLKKFA
jgi:hypothetical protein